MRIGTGPRGRSQRPIENCGDSMKQESEKLRRIVVQGWLGMLLLLIIMIIADLIEFGMKGDFSPLINDPGIVGLWFIAVISCVSVLTQMFLRTYDAYSCRWAFFYMTFAYTSIFITHQLYHLVAGAGFNIHFLLDVTHHILGVWATIAAYRWAKLGARNEAIV